MLAKLERRHLRDSPNGRCYFLNMGGCPTTILANVAHATLTDRCLRVPPSFVFKGRAIWLHWRRDPSPSPSQAPTLRPLDFSPAAIRKIGPPFIMGQPTPRNARRSQRKGKWAPLAMQTLEMSDPKSTPPTTTKNATQQMGPPAKKQNKCGCPFGFQ